MRFCDRLHYEIGYVVPMLFSQCCTVISFDIAHLPQRSRILVGKTVETGTSKILNTQKFKQFRKKRDDPIVRGNIVENSIYPFCVDILRPVKIPAHDAARKYDSLESAGCVLF